MPRGEKDGFWLQYSVAFVASITTAGYGCISSWTSPALPFLKSGKSNLLIKEEELRWIAPLVPIGIIIGNLINPIFIDRIGRKWTLLLFAVPQITSWLMILLSRTSRVICIARMVGGIGYGGGICAAIVYLSEIGNRKNRGIFLTFIKFSSSFGIFFTNFLGAFLPYFYMNLCLLIMPLIFVIVFPFMPNSSYFFEKNRAIEEMKLNCTISERRKSEISEASFLVGGNFVKSDSFVIEDRLVKKIYRVKEVYNFEDETFKEDYNFKDEDNFKEDYDFQEEDNSQDGVSFKEISHLEGVNNLKQDNILKEDSNLKENTKSTEDAIKEDNKLKESKLQEECNLKEVRKFKEDTKLQDVQLKDYAGLKEDKFQDDNKLKKVTNLQNENNLNGDCNFTEDKKLKHDNLKEYYVKEDNKSKEGIFKNDNNEEIFKEDKCKALKLKEDYSVKNDFNLEKNCRSKKNSLSEIFVTKKRRWKNSSFWKLLSVPSNIRGLLIICLVTTLDCFSGHPALIYFSQQMLTYEGSLLSPEKGALFVTTVKLIASIVATQVIERFKRRSILLSTGILAILTQGVLAIFFFLKDSKINLSFVGFLPYLAFLIFETASTIGASNLFYIYQGEFFKNDVKGLAVTLTKIFHMFMIFITIFIYEILVTKVSSYVIFFIFCIAGVIFCTICMWFTPETKGKTLDEIQIVLQRREYSKF